MSRKKGGLTAALATIAVLTVLAVGMGVASASGPSPSPKPPPPPPPPPAPAPVPAPKPAPAPVPVPVPGPPPPPPVLEFDLDTNWGVCPMELRKVLAIAELASGIPGLARAGFVKWWQAFRAGQALVAPDLAADIAASHPQLCRLCLNVGDKAASTALIEKNVALGWPEPKDAAGWKAGSRGLGDILGGTAVYQGIEDAALGNKQYALSRLPLINLPAKDAMERTDVQAWLLGVLVWQFLAGVDYKVLASGKENDDGDSYNTWGNIFSAWAAPAKFKAGQGAEAKARYLERALECGIDLTKVAYPWPKGKSYKYGNDKGDVPSMTGFQPYYGVWHRVQIYFPLGVSNIGGGNGQQQQQGMNLKVLHQLAGGQIGQALITAISDPTKPAPLVVLFHDRGADVDQLAGLLPPGLAARAVAIRGSLKAPGGYMYFAPDLTDPAVAGVLLASAKVAAESVRKLLVTYPTTRVIAVGYSQGGAIALRLAEIGLADLALGVATMLPGSLAPSVPSQAVIRMVHGSADAQIPATAANATAEAFSAIGAPNQIDVVQGAGHALSGLLGPAREALQLLLSQPSPATKGYSLTANCDVAVSSAATSLRFLLPAVQDGTAQISGWGKLTTPDALRQALVSKMAEDDPQCQNGQFLPLDKASAAPQYLILRGIFQNLILRGALTTAQGLAMLSDAKNKAVGAGALPGDLPAFEGV